MWIELSTWGPLAEFSAILIVLGAAGCLTAREREAWWMSQGLLLLGVLVGLASVGRIHAEVDSFSMLVWMPLVLLLELLVVWLAPKASSANEVGGQSGQHGSDQFRSDQLSEEA